MSYDIKNKEAYRANNSMSARDMFLNRALYSGFAFSEDGEVNFTPWSTKNFWFLENLFYGRIREKSGEILTISPKKELLSNCRKTSGTSPVRVLDFVSDAYEEFRTEYDKSSLRMAPNTIISQGSAYLSEPAATAGAPQAFSGRKKIISKMNSIFISYVDNFKGETNNIFSFEEFAPFFMEFLVDFLKIAPVTHSSYLLSKHSTPLSSGLCLEIAPLSHSNDEGKSSHFLDNENFHIYRHIAANSGFAIDKNAPWRLVADIASKKMLEFASNRVAGISTTEDILDYYYEDVKESVDELEEFKAMMVRSFNTFATSRPTVSQTSIGPNQTIVRNLKKRKREPFDDVVSRLKNDFWYEKFVRVKNIELSLGYSDTEIRNMANNARDLEDSLDRVRAVGYLNKRMTPVVASEGSLVHEDFRFKGSSAKGSAKEDAQGLARRLNRKLY